MIAKDHYSIRVILINDKNELLLMRAEDKTTTRPDGKYNGHFWFIIGGEQEPGESIEDTAKREIFEETGLNQNDYNLGPVVWQGEFDLILAGKPRRMKQQFIVANTSKNKVDLSNLTIAEKEVITNIKWFSLEDIKNCKEVIYPVLLPQYLPDILNNNYPDEPIIIDLGKNPD